MNLGEMDGRERAALLGALLLVAAVFLVASYNYLNPPKQVWEAKVFETFVSGDNETTIVFSYGVGKLKFKGLYDFELDETYRVTYRSRNRNWAEFDISIEKIS
ncbi:hypothetical protein JXL21_04915 [Candidatus Bathyarchaeota archaeon]|nr:hypothetical protein [Candidatus Bathyarchaeota archaeon]